jgi:hypothetical protein
MPPIFELTPRRGMGPVLLGMSRDDVRAAMSSAGFPCLTPESTGKALDYFCANALQVEYDSNGAASFIGAACSESFLVTYFGLDVFDATAHTVFAAIAQRETAPHAFTPLRYTFREQIVTLYEANKQYDHRGDRKRVVWGQIGCGSPSYLAAIDGTAERTRLWWEENGPWGKATAGQPDDAFKSYQPSIHVQVGDLLRHPKFGTGVVTAVLAATKAEVEFREGKKTLAFGHRPA